MYKKYNIIIKYCLLIILAMLLITFVGCDSFNNNGNKQKQLFDVSININEDGEFSSSYNYKAEEGSKIEMPELPRVDHHECVGFYFGDKLWDFENDIVTGNVDLIAKWVESITDYEIVMDLIDKIDINNYTTIKEARDKYEALSANNKKFVDNYRYLYKAEIDYFNYALADAETEEDLNDVLKLINSYPTETLLKIGNAIKNIYNRLFELTYQDKINDANNHQQDVVKAVGNAYLFKGVYNQYDQTRRVAGATPYVASEYDTLYLDCSAYCYSIYTYIFGASHNVNLNTASNNSYAKAHQESDEIVYYVDTTKYKTKEEQQTLLQEIYNNLQVGDLINYRHGKTSGTAGHVMMYIGNGTIIHSTGDDMSSSEYSSNPELFREAQTTTEAAIGTVFTFEASQLFFDTTSSRYLFKNNSSDTVWEFAVIRPLAKKMKISNQALSNYLLSDVDIAKTSSVGARTSVKRGQEITYTITFTNHSDQEIINIPIFKEVPRYFDYVSSSDNGLFIDGVGVMHSITLKAKETKQVTYVFKVKDDESITGSINDGATYIHNISLPKISNTVVYDYDMTAFVNNALYLIENNTYSNSYDFINDCYKAIIEVELADLFGSEVTESMFIDSNKYKVPDVNKGSTVKRVLSKYLECGDILSYYNQATKEYNTYLYIKDDLMVTIKNGSFSILKTRSAIQSLLDKMFAMNKYQLIRPTMIQ